MGKKLFVGGLPYSVDDKELQELFSKFGEVASAQVITDRVTNQSKGFGFVEMVNDEDATKAIQELDKTQYSGRMIAVNEARPKEPRFGNGGGDNYGSSRGGDRRDSGRRY